MVTVEEVFVEVAGEAQPVHRVRGKVHGALDEVALCNEFYHLAAVDEVVGFLEHLLLALAGTAEEQGREQGEYDDFFHCYFYSGC